MWRNGLYSVHVSLGDGRVGKGSGILMCRDGVLRGGDAYLFYIGTYHRSGDVVLGEVVVNGHTPPGPGASPLFAGRQVGIGFTGREKAGRILLDGTAFVGRESVLFRASMMYLTDLGEEQAAGQTV